MVVLSDYLRSPHSSVTAVPDAAHMWAMNSETAPNYHALRNLSDRTRHSRELLPRRWTDAETDALYHAMSVFFPNGTKVTAVYPDMTDLATFRTFTGTVLGAESVFTSEPSFHVQDASGSSILVPGSLLTVHA